MASSSSSSSHSAPAVSYDVFLSFRGEDTRKTFVDHLYSALVQQGIDTYKDDETLPRGESIGTSLLKSIEESQIAVIIFSANYANSSWCLDELVHIMKCRDTRGQIVMPIFYDVDPSTVRKLKEEYGEAFSKHKLENNNKVEAWKNALVDASKISGWEPKNIANGHEAKAIKKIVEEIISRLQQVTTNTNERLIGIASRVHRLKSALQMDSGGIIMIGIWGVGGGGKTTLASSLYDEISLKFNGSCFIENIREQSSRPDGLEKLEKKILSEMGVKKSRRGRGLKNKILHSRKVLVVLDDVNRIDQLEALAGYADWFGKGSRIIITTRDEHLLKAHGVVVYDISLLQDHEAIELFHKHAFQGLTPKKEYEELSKAVVSYAGGLPLALKVLGSSLCDKNIKEWRNALERLKDFPETEILEKLKLSFDGLTKVQKDLFLDIACFFKGKDKDLAMDFLDACGFYPVIGVEELRQKALITISKDGELDMHDLLQEMAHNIVRGKHPKNPEKHSRVWKEEDVLTLCDTDATMKLDKIEAIHVDYDSLLEDEEPCHPPVFAKMRNLRYLYWKGDLPDLPRGLCCLILEDAIQDHLWNGCKVLPNLKIMVLYNLENLIRTPNFDGIPNLERFVLRGCRTLEEIHSSFGRLEKLVCLSIEKCKGLKITRYNTPTLMNFSPEPTKLLKIQEKVKRLLGFDDVSSAVPHLSNLKDIRLCSFRRDLTKLNLSGCNLRDEDISSSAVWELPNLQELELRENNFTRLNFSLMQTPQLKLLNVSKCMYLVKLSELPSSLAVIIAEDCYSLKTIEDFLNCKWLWKVSLRNSERVQPRVCQMFIDSMIKGNASEDHLISLVSFIEIPEGFLGNTLSMRNAGGVRLPHDWYTGFCGFFIHVVAYVDLPYIRITFKEEKPDEELPFETDKALDRDCESYASEGFVHKLHTYVGYVSFNSLRPTSCFNSANNTVIQISVPQSSFASKGENRIRVALVPRKSEDDPVQTTQAPTDASEFLDNKYHIRWPTSRIKHDSKSSVTIEWRP